MVTFNTFSTTITRNFIRSVKSVARYCTDVHVHFKVKDVNVNIDKLTNWDGVVITATGVRKIGLKRIISDLEEDKAYIYDTVEYDNQDKTLKIEGRLNEKFFAETGRQV